MGITYYDAREGRNRIKPRYIWGFWSFLAGVLTGVAVLEMLL